MFLLVCGVVGDRVVFESERRIEVRITSPLEFLEEIVEFLYTLVRIGQFDVKPAVLLPFAVFAPGRLHRGFEVHQLHMGDSACLDAAFDAVSRSRDIVHHNVHSTVHKDVPDSDGLQAVHSPSDSMIERPGSTHAILVYVYPISFLYNLFFRHSIPR
jgi:hypothetical protein